ncbi:rhamnulokinase [Streptococcus marmotae]|uniref:rhamnulokinase n=1 Tax=Streptococcus marmotae TaxID=1825069 RepID=UPI0008345F36|nr:rhamnulokinase [Streptococcus marmotae]
MTYHIAVDIGASSGRVILARKTHQLELEEIHRFPNHFRKEDGYDRWNVTQLVEHIFVGLEKIKQKGIEKATLGIDTWAVDYCLVDKQGNLLAQPIAYRDHRTNGAMETVFQKIPRDVIYQKTGIQFLAFNTLYQLAVESQELLEQVDKILLIPDYIAYCLTGKMLGEVSNVSTTQLLNSENRKYDEELLEILGLPVSKFPDLVESGTVIGTILPEHHARYELPDVDVIAVATHDTASAVVGVPAITEQWAYISSGTWSLIGTENEEAIVTKEAYQANYTNEWGAYQTYRFLKNITGMWCIQEIAREYEGAYSFQEMAEAASHVKPFLQTVDLNDPRFTNPHSMVQEIQAYCHEHGEQVPETLGELVMCVYSNLATLYAKEFKRLEELTGKHFDCLHIVGGGSNVQLLNQLTANCIQRTVIAGPSEATAIGNLLVQMISQGEFANLAEARTWLEESMTFQLFQPQQ